MEINDIVHGQFSIPEDVAHIVKTQHFQRLKRIRQLGFLKLDEDKDIEHNRYAHCLGTYYGASLMLDALEKNTSVFTHNNELAENSKKNQYKIPPVYRKAVQLAALLHDIGHGPFSHAWEYVVQDYYHEQLALPCVDAIFQQLDAKLFPELRDNNNYGIELIKALILGDLMKFKYELPKHYQFIFEIVSNKKTNIDVDKWDYLRRDCYYLNSMCEPNIDFNDVFLKAKISACGTHIEYRYEDYNKIYNLFAARYSFHVNCYSLPEHYLGNFIISMAIQEIEPKINNILITQIDSHMPEFLQLTDDYVLDLVGNSKLRSCLHKDTLFIEMPYEFIKENLLSSNDFIIKVETLPIIIKSVTMFMPSEENLSFYGFEGNKSVFNDRTTTIQRVYPCFCDVRDNVVYYSELKLVT